MESINFYEKLPESSKEMIKSEINITNNEEFVSWISNVPDEVLLNHFNIPKKLILEIKQSEQYLTFKTSKDNYRFGYIPDEVD